MWYKAILFDLSGTLVNYRGSVVGWEAMERLGFTAVYELLHTNGYRDQVPAADLFHSAAFARLKEAWHQTITGQRNLHLHDLLREAMRAQGMEPDDRMIALAVEHYCSAISAGARPRLGAERVLRVLKEQGRRVGLISNTMWPGARHHADLERFELAQFLDTELYSADCNAWKPSPAVFQLALQELGGIAPEHALFVGDSPIDDITGAHNSGMRAVWILTGEHPLDAGGDADAVIRELPDLLPLLAEWEA